MVLPQTGGPYEIAGQGAVGEQLFSLRFDMPELVDGEGGSGFVFVLPTDAGWERSLAGITLSGPGGTAVLNGEPDSPLTILRDPRTGRIRGILRGVTAADHGSGRVGTMPPGPVLEVHSSYGIPDPEAWNEPLSFLEGQVRRR